MSQSLPSAMLQHVRQLAGAADRPEASDRDLLNRYCANHDESAFAVLVHRHGPLVWSVCRRTLRQPQDAEDAFQATFLVLARKAAAIPWRDSVAPWLYSVAQRLAHKVRVEAARRPAVPPLPSPGDPLVALTARELLSALDEEVSALPEKYRDPIVLCWLSDNTLAETAKLLDVSVSTVQRRLEYGRKRLHSSLTRRGLAIPAALGVVGLARSATLAVPARVLASAGAQPVSVQAARLAELMLLSSTRRLTPILALVLAAGITLAGFGLSGKPQRPPAVAGKVPPVLLPQANKEPERKDVHGDPLPPGALARMGTVRLKHRSRFLAAAFSADAKTLVSLSRRLRAWDFPSGKQLWQVEQGDGVSDRPFILSPDGKSLAAAVSVEEVHVLDLRTGNKICSVRGEFAPLAFSPDSRILAMKDKTTVRLHDSGTGRIIRLLKETTAGLVRHAAFTRNGKSLISVDDRGCIRVWDVPNAKVTRQFTPAPGLTLADHLGQNEPDVVNPDGSVVALALKDAGFVVLDVATNKERFRIPKGRGALAFSADGKRLACAVGQAVVVMEVATGKRVASLADNQGQVVAALSADGRTLATAYNQCFPRLWDVDTGKEKPRAPEHRTNVGAVVFSPSGQMLATVSEDDTVLLWNSKTGRHLRTITRKHDFRLGRWVFFSPDGKTVTTQHDLQSFASVDVATGKEGKPVYVRNALGAVISSPDGSVLVIDETDYGPKRILHLVNARTGKGIRSFTTPCSQQGGRSQPADQIVFSPDGTKLAVSDFLNTIRVYDVRTGKKVRQIVDGNSPAARMVMAIAFSPDGRMLASAGGGYGGRWNQPPHPDNGICLWDVGTGDLLLKLKTPGRPFLGERGLVNTVAFTPDGRTLASGGRTAECIWEVATGMQLGHFQDEGNVAHHVRFSPGGEKLASAMGDGSTLVWDCKPLGGLLPKEKPAREVARLWKLLGEKDSAIAHRAVYTLASTPDETVPFLRGKLKPVPTVAAKRVRQLLTDLDSDEFARRESSMKELERLGSSVEDELRQALPKAASLEMKKRLERLLEVVSKNWPAMSPEDRRSVRGVWVLQRIGNAEARMVLKGLATGTAGARLTREARNALAWLDRRAK